jgi:hypothetical protein
MVGFWQLLLDPQATAFTMPGQGQYQCDTTSMGLLGALASFQRLMETLVHMLPDVIIYINNLDPYLPISMSTALLNP